MGCREDKVRSTGVLTYSLSVLKGQSGWEVFGHDSERDVETRQLKSV